MRMVECILDKKLLILGAGPDQVAGILKAKEMGIYTIALDGNKDAIGFKYSDEFYEVNIKSLDEVDSFLDSYFSPIDGVIAFGVDIPYIIAHAATKLDVNYTISKQSAKKSEDKFIAKELMKKMGLKIPEYKLVNNKSQIEDFIVKVGFPIIIKPVDNSAARGISYINSYENLEDYYHHALSLSEKKMVIVENYLKGPQISTESFIINEKIYNIGFADRNYNDMGRFLPNIIENGGDLPSIFIKEKHKIQLKRYLAIISKEMNIKNGVIKGDIVIYNDELYVIEFALRLSGGNFSTIEIPESTGVDFLRIAIKLHLNLEVSEEELEIKKNDSISLRYKFLEDIDIQSINNIIVPPKESFIIEYKIYLKEGDLLIDNKTKNHLQRVAYVISRGTSRLEAIEYANNFLNKIEFT